MIQNLNKLIDYIEENLTGELSLTEIAQQMGISDYHLKRTFSFVAGMTLTEYVKNRRLALANQDLISGKKVTEVAFSYGYQTVEGFSRAFREWSGYLPSEIRKIGIQKSFLKLSFYIEVRGGISMEFKIEKKAPFRLVGVSKRVPIQFEGENQRIVELAQSITEKQREEMHQLGDLYPHQVVNASYHFDEGRLAETGSLTHMIGFLTSKENIFSDLEQITVPEHTWAIFPNRGKFPEVLQETMALIFSEWLPSSEYQLVEAPEISFTSWTKDQENLASEIWLAVTKKEGITDEG
ncbi:AraC family transcriptional regulator [Enterococcus sp. DIV0175]|uniref:AraC family transcriptional regulator n=1 Tax=Enterococcus sp. DIV0175 TaxID=2774768 RepID=UPI003D301029